MIVSDVWVAESGAPDSPRIVLVHGSLDRSAGLLKLSRRLDRRYHVVRFDRRGYGRSSEHDGPFDMAGNVDDLVAIVEATGDGPVVLVGHSYGGNVCLAATQRRPDLVAAVAVFESPQSWEPWWSGRSAGSHALAAGDDDADAAERFMRRLIGDARWERLPPATRAARRAEGRAMVAELADLRLRRPWDADKIRVPVLVMYGEHGQPHHRDGAHRLVAALPDAAVHEVAGAHHFGPNTHPDAVAALLTGFVAGVEAHT